MSKSMPLPSIIDLGFETYANRVGLDLGAFTDVHFARVVEEHRTRWILWGNDGQLDASVRGALHYDLDTQAFPKVGDWVMYTPSNNNNATIETILPRSTTVTRKKASSLAPQIIVTNIDTVIIVQAADQELNISKLERYLVLAHDSGARPLIVITKADMRDDLPAYIAIVQAAAPEVAVVSLSAKTGVGMDVLAAELPPRETAVLLGSSGAGKSTLTNALMKRHVQLTQAVRKDDGKGRHTTTVRSLFVLPSGALVIDTPGMRELSTAEIDDEKKDEFLDVVEIACGCKYPSCDHAKSAGCAVLAAVEDGKLDKKRYQKYMQYLEKESKKATVYTESNTHSERVKSNRANLNYQSRRQSEEE